jgi:hypothetical protein
LLGELTLLPNFASSLLRVNSFAANPPHWILKSFRDSWAGYSLNSGQALRSG